MRIAESISVAFYLVFIAASAVAPVSADRRIRALAIGVAGITGAWALQLLDGVASGPFIRDVAPGLLLLIGYKQSGQFFVSENVRIRSWLGAIDERWFPWVLRLTSQLPSRRHVWQYLEAAYFMCFPVVPLAVVALYLAGQRGEVDRFWTIVLPPTLLCYALTVVFPNMAPRMVATDAGFTLRRPGVGALNDWILRRAAIAGNTFPSGHVACSLAVAFVLLDVVPAIGLIGLWVATSIAFATMVLRYHYAADVVLGAAFACLSFICLG